MDAAAAAGAIAAVAAAASVVAAAAAAVAVAAATATTAARAAAIPDEGLVHQCDVCDTRLSIVDHSPAFVLHVIDRCVFVCLYVFLCECVHECVLAYC